MGDSQPFSPLELIAMSPGKRSVTTKRQQIGNKAEKERNTAFRGVPHVNDNSICVNDLIFLRW